MKLVPIVLICVPVVFGQSVEAPKQAIKTNAPALLYKVEADYTAEARSKGIEGASRLYTEISRDGFPVNIRVVKSLDPGLDAKAIKALKQWRFRPAERDGKPISVSATIEFLFRLSKFSVFQDPSLKENTEPQEEDILSSWLNVFN
jgi:TonB family protein